MLAHASGYAISMRQSVYVISMSGVYVDSVYAACASRVHRIVFLIRLAGFLLSSSIVVIPLSICFRFGLVLRTCCGVHSFGLSIISFSSVSVLQ